MVLHFNELEFHSPKIFLLSRVEIGRVVLEKEIFKSRQCNFTVYLPIISLVKVCVPSFEQTCFVSGSNLVGIDPVIQERSFKVVNVFLVYSYYLPLEKDVAFYSKRIERPSSMDASCHVGLKLAHFLNNVAITSPWIMMSKLASSSVFTQECFVPSLVNEGLLVLEK